MAGSTRQAVEADGLLVAPIHETGLWGALRALRSGMRMLAGEARPRTTFLTAISDEGRLVRGGDPEASVLVLGYRTGGE